MISFPTSPGYPTFPTPEPTDREPASPRELWRKVYRGIRVVSSDLGGRAWFNMIDPDRLDLGDPYSCILGQIYADAWDDKTADEWLEHGERISGYWFAVREILAVDADGEEYPGEDYGFVSWGTRMEQTRLENVWRLALAKLPQG